MTPEYRSGRGTFFALALIVAGAILFIDNLGILPGENVRAYWPIAFVVAGLGLVANKVCASSIVWAGALSLFGVVLILGNLGMIRADANVFWPILLIALGALALVKRTYGPGRPRRYWGGYTFPGVSPARPRGPGTGGTDEGLNAGAGSGQNAQSSSYDATRAPEAWWGKHEWRQWRREQRHRRFVDFVEHGYSKSSQVGSWINEDAVFFSTRRSMAGREVSGGKMAAVFGSIEIDLTDATIPLRAGADGTVTRTANIEANAVFGSIDVRVPQTWRVLNRGVGVFGSYENKTLPPRAEPGAEVPTLFIHGGAVFGSVEIGN